MPRPKRREHSKSKSLTSEEESKFSSPRPWGTFGISKLVSGCQRLYARSKVKTDGALSPEQPPTEQPLPRIVRIFVRRHGETEGVYFRSNRLFNANHCWYFAMREGEHLGPFKDRKRAEIALAVFIAERVVAAPTHSDSARKTDGDEEMDEEMDEMVEEALDLIQIKQKRGTIRASVWALDRIKILRGADNQTQYPL